MVFPGAILKNLAVAGVVNVTFKQQDECLMSRTHCPFSALAKNGLSERDDVFFAGKNQLFHPIVLPHVPTRTRHDSRRSNARIFSRNAADFFKSRLIEPIQRAANVDKRPKVLHVTGRSFRATESIALDFVEEGRFVDLDSVLGVAQIEAVELDQRRPGGEMWKRLGYYSGERHGGNSRLCSLCQAER